MTKPRWTNNNIPLDVYGTAVGYPGSHEDDSLLWTIYKHLRAIMVLAVLLVVWDMILVEQQAVYFECPLWIIGLVGLVYAGLTHMCLWCVHRRWSVALAVLVGLTVLVFGFFACVFTAVSTVCEVSGWYRELWVVPFKECQIDRTRFGVIGALFGPGTKFYHFYHVMGTVACILGCLVGCLLLTQPVYLTAAFVSEHLAERRRNRRAADMEMMEDVVYQHQDMTLHTVD